MAFTNKDRHQHHVDYESDMYTGVTTFHGLVRIYNSKNWWGRSFWISLSFLAMSLFFVQSYYTLMAYKSKPTAVESNFEVPVGGIEFPDITICNFNPTSTQYVAEYNMSADVQRYVMYSYLQVENLYSQVTDSDFHKIHQEYLNYTAQYKATKGYDFDLQTFFMDVGYKCEDMFMECSFGGFVIENCCDYAVATLTDIGLCYRFSEFGNHTWTQKQLISGAYYGLHMIIDAQLDNYPDIYVENYLDAGIKFYIHPDDVIPMLSSMGSAIPPSSKGFGAVTLRNYTFLSHDDWGQCMRTFDAEKFNHSRNVSYHSGNCEAVCITNYFLDRCNCTPLRYLLPHSGDNVCEPMDMYKCINVTKMSVAAFLEESETYWYSSCNCSIECDRLDFNVEMSYSDFPNRAAAKGLGRIYNRTSHYVKENFLVLNVYMKEILQETYNQQKQLTQTAVLSDVGGNMGMFLGMSVITLGEILLYFVKCAWGGAHRRRRLDLARREADEDDGPAPAERSATTYSHS